MEGASCFLYHFQQLMIYNDEIETRNQKVIPFSLLIGPNLSLSVSNLPLLGIVPNLPSETFLFTTWSFFINYPQHLDTAPKWIWSFSSRHVVRNQMRAPNQLKKLFRFTNLIPSLTKETIVILYIRLFLPLSHIHDLLKTCAVVFDRMSIADVFVLHRVVPCTTV